MNGFQNYLDKKLKQVVFEDVEEEKIENVDCIEKEIAEVIIRVRTEKGITQKELSKLTGIQQANISKIENGEGNPSIKILNRIAIGLNKKLRITMEWWIWKML